VNLCGTFPPARTHFCLDPEASGATGDALLSAQSSLKDSLMRIVELPDELGFRTEDGVRTTINQ
jgi:hypothetical protein